MKKTMLEDRAGLTLMEILVSIFVLSVGMLGVLSALPIGGYALNRATIADRSAACGRSALAEARVRDMANPENWAADYGSGYQEALAPNCQEYGVQYADSMLIDPLFEAENAGYPVSGTEFPHDFPYHTSSQAAGPTTTLRRITLKQFTGVPMPLEVAQRIFTWEDQLELGELTDEDTRPKMKLVHSDGKTYEYPARPWETPGGTPLVNSNEDEYTWMLSVMPITTEQDPDDPGYSTADQITGYEISAVVSQKRDMLCPLDTTSTPEALEEVRETAFDCEIIGGGYGGGDVKLTGSAIELAMFRDVEYMMLAGTEPGFSGPRTVCHWYRVAAYGDVDPDGAGGGSVWVSLVGPDWEYGPCTAIVSDGVVGVYTTTVSGDKNLRWDR